MKSKVAVTVDHHSFMRQADIAGELMFEKFQELLAEGYAQINGSAGLLSPDGKTQIDFN